MTYLVSSLLSVNAAAVRSTSVLAPERHADSSRLSSPLIERLARLERRRVQMKTDRRTSVTRILDAMQTHRIWTPH